MRAARLAIIIVIRPPAARRIRRVAEDGEKTAARREERGEARRFADPIAVAICMRGKTGAAGQFAVNVGQAAHRAEIRIINTAEVKSSTVYD